MPFLLALTYGSSLELFFLQTIFFPRRLRSHAPLLLQPFSYPFTNHLVLTPSLTGGHFFSAETRFIKIIFFFLKKPGFFESKSLLT